ncbi:MAG: hypothetical protein MHM6MM_000488 [Cercozoa sp. M6MM]
MTEQEQAAPISLEEHDGVRLVWNVVPRRQADCKTIVVPPSALATPLKTLPEMPRVGYDPVKCKRCFTVLNPFCRVDAGRQSWQCSSCLTTNHLSSQEVPLEVHSNYTSIEYQLSEQPRGAPVIMFLVDRCVVQPRAVDIKRGAKSELEHAKKCLLDAIDGLPDSVYVGLMSVGAHVELHELGTAAAQMQQYQAQLQQQPNAEGADLAALAASYITPRALVFRGDCTAEDVSVTRVAAMLGLGSGQQGAAQQTAVRYLVPAAHARALLPHLLDDMVDKDPCGKKPGIVNDIQAAGTAFAVGVGVLQNCVPGHPARLVALIGAAPTVGPGRVAECDKTIRTHHDLNKGTAPLVAPAKAFYSDLANRALVSGYAVDLFCCALEQTGLMEMSTMARRTGGALVLSDKFLSDVFVQSLRKLMRRQQAWSQETNEMQDTQFLACAFDAQMSVFTSPQLKISGALGDIVRSQDAVPADQKKTKKVPVPKHVAKQQIGLGGTASWHLGSVANCDTNTVTLFFEVEAGEGQHAGAESSIVQLQTVYTHSSGARLLRVTTFAMPMTDFTVLTPNDKGKQQLVQSPQGKALIAEGFDQEAAAAVMAKLAMHKLRDGKEQPLDVLLWLDRCLVRLMQCFASFQPGHVETFELAPQMAVFPQFMFHLRRSQFLQVFGDSPDETVFYRSALVRETTGNVATMVMPQLFQYHHERGLSAAPLDAEARASDTILLLDAYFHLVRWYGMDVAKWRDQKLWETPGYEFFEEFLQHPVAYTSQVADARNPHPVVVVCDENTSQARFLDNKLNPSRNHSNTAVQGEKRPIFTDDVPLDGFMTKLRQYAVKPS